MQGRETLDFIEDQLTEIVENFLSEHLPRIGGKNWWQLCVLDTLQKDFRRSAETYKKGDLSRFDLAGLTYIISKQWYPLSQSAGINTEINSYLFEIKTFRNSVRHDRQAEFPPEQLAHLLESARYAAAALAPKSAALALFDERIAAMRALTPAAKPGNPGKRRLMYLGISVAVAVVTGICGYLLMPSSETVLTGEVIRVVDGDTIELSDSSGRKQIVQLAGIDAPEPDQAHGKKATEALSAITLEKNVSVRVVATDRYGRPIGIAMLNDQDVGLRLVKEGHAWVYRKYLGSLPKAMREPYRKAETDAMSAKLGLWASDSPQAPWDWRHAARKAPSKSDRN